MRNRAVSLEFDARRHVVVTAFFRRLVVRRPILQGGAAPAEEMQAALAPELVPHRFFQVQF